MATIGYRTNADTNPNQTDVGSMGFGEKLLDKLYEFLFDGG